MHNKLVGIGVSVALLSVGCGSGGGGRESSGASESASSSSGIPVDTDTSGTDAGLTTSTSGDSEGVTATEPTPTTGDGLTDTTEPSTGGSSSSETGDSTTLPGTTDGTDTDAETGDTTDTGVLDDPLWVTPNLWYSVENKLHYVKLDETDGSVVELVTSTISTPLLDGFNGLTMLEDGSLLGSRVLEGMGTQIFHVPEPPVEPSTIEVDILGMVPDTLIVEALYTDCKGLVYLMDSGADLSTADGNRLIRFTGQYLAGDFDYEVITDLQNSVVADIDDLGPGIDLMGEITDGSGFAIDSGEVYRFDYNLGSGLKLGDGGTWGSHALGGPLFTDAKARLYLLDIDARLFEADPVTIALSPVLTTGPKPEGDAPAGWSGLTGPLTECESTLPQ